MQLLDQLDGYALQTKRAITIPLIRDAGEPVKPVAARVALFDLDHTLLPIDSDHAWGVFTTTIGWTDPVEFARRNDEFYAQYKAGTLDIHDYVRFAVERDAGCATPRLAARRSVSCAMWSRPRCASRRWRWCRRITRRPATRW
jgi:hypothetical protein